MLMFLALFSFVKVGNRLLLSTPDPPKTFGDLYFALGKRSVSEKMFLDNRIVFSIISFSPSVVGIVIDCVSSGKNFLIRDSMIGNWRIWSHVGL